MDTDSTVSRRYTRSRHEYNENDHSNVKSPREDEGKRKEREDDKFCTCLATALDGASSFKSSCSLLTLVNSLLPQLKKSQQAPHKYSYRAHHQHSEQPTSMRLHWQRSWTPKWTQRPGSPSACRSDSRSLS
jgi:hypothetical protein